MTKILEEEIASGSVAVYVNDIIAAAYSLSDLALLTAHILSKLSDNNLKINLEKCEFGKTKVTFLGRVIDGQTKTTKQNSIDKLRNMQRLMMSIL